MNEQREAELPDRWIDAMRSFGDGPAGTAEDWAEIEAGVTPRAIASRPRRRRALPLAAAAAAVIVVVGLALAMAGRDGDTTQTATGDDPVPSTSVSVKPGVLSDEQILDHARDIAARSGDEDPDRIEWVRVDSRSRAREVILGDGGSADDGDQPVIVVGMRGSFTDAAFREGDPFAGEGGQGELLPRAAVYFTIDESHDIVMDIVATNDIADLTRLGPTSHP